MERWLPLIDVVTRLLLGLMAMGQWGFIAWWVLTHGTPKDDKDIVILIVNVANGIVSFVLGYYYGSSASSAAKDRALTSSRP